jgi:hypothetical protein
MSSYAAEQGTLDVVTNNTNFAYSSRSLSDVACLQVSSYAAEQGTPDESVRLLVSWPSISRELRYLEEDSVTCVRSRQCDMCGI